MADEVKGPEDYSKSGLLEVGVEIVDYVVGTLRCAKCGKQWSPIQDDGSHPRGFWKCPNECNC